MAKLLYIESSPRKERSVSIAVAKAFLDAYRQANPDDKVETWDLWTTTLPEFDGEIINAKYQIMHGQDHTPAQAAAWKSVVEAFERFNSADKYLLSVPMWNFGIPYKLKHFIDVITQPGLAFKFSPESGYAGLVTGKPIAVTYARGGAYGGSEEGAAMDFQMRYLDLLLGFVGFADIRNIIAEPTADPEKAAEAKADALAEARAIAARF